MIWWDLDRMPVLGGKHWNDINVDLKNFSNLKYNSGQPTTSGLVMK